MKSSSIAMERQSPVHLPGKPVKVKLREHWPVVLEYADEGAGPWIVDLSRCRRWDIQGRELGEAWPAGLPLPESPGSVLLHAKGLAARTGRRQAVRWLFDDKAAAPSGAGCTETTEGTLCLALLGRDVFRITEKLTALDLADPKRGVPFFLPGPFCHVTAQLAVLRGDPDEAVVLVAAARGFAHDMVHAVLAAGEEFGLRPAGESRFLEKLKPLPWMDGLEKPNPPPRKPAAADKPKSSSRSRSKIRIDSK